MKRQQAWGWFFVTPYVLSLLIFFVGPLLLSFYFTLTDYDLFNPPKFIGLENWTEILQSVPFWKAVRNTAVLALIFVPLQTILALLFAYALNEITTGAKLLRTLYFFPVITPWVGAGLIWVWIFNPEVGVLNSLLGLIGVGPFEWLYSTKWWVVIASIALVNVWKSVGYSMVIYLAGMQNITNEILEASRIDGASRWDCFAKIIVPLISPTTFMIVILSTIGAFQVFDSFLVLLTTGGPRVIPDDVNCINLMLYDTAFQFSKMGYASTMAWFLFIVVALLSLVQNKLEKRWVHYE